MPRCNIIGCGIKKGNRSNITLHKLPTDKIKRKIWLESIGADLRTSTNSIHVCSQHFEDSCFKQTQDNKTLREDAVPTKTSWACRVCLATHVKMFDMKGSVLSEMFQDITGISVCDENKIVPHHVCWDCSARLQAAAAFRDKALFSDRLFTGVVQNKSNFDDLIRQYHGSLKSPLSIQNVFKTAVYGCGHNRPDSLETDGTSFCRTEPVTISFIGSAEAFRAIDPMETYSRSDSHSSNYTDIENPTNETACKDDEPMEISSRSDHHTSSDNKDTENPTDETVFEKNDPTESEIRSNLHTISDSKGTENLTNEKVCEDDEPMDINSRSDHHTSSDSKDTENPANEKVCEEDAPMESEIKSNPHIISDNKDTENTTNEKVCDEDARIESEIKLYPNATSDSKDTENPTNETVYEEDAPMESESKSDPNTTSDNKDTENTTNGKICEEDAPLESKIKSNPHTISDSKDTENITNEKFCEDDESMETSSRSDHHTSSDSKDTENPANEKVCEEDAPIDNEIKSDPNTTSDNKDTENTTNETVCEADETKTNVGSDPLAENNSDIRIKVRNSDQVFIVQEVTQPSHIYYNINGKVYDRNEVIAVPARRDDCMFIVTGDHDKSLNQEVLEDIWQGILKRDKENAQRLNEAAANKAKNMTQDGASSAEGNSLNNEKGMIMLKNILVTVAVTTDQTGESVTVHHHNN